jgi:hypothetical protein
MNAVHTWVLPLVATVGRLTQGRREHLNSNNCDCAADEFRQFPPSSQ